MIRRIVICALVLALVGQGQTWNATSYAVGPSPRAITLIDRGSDGVLDLAVTNSDSTVTLLDAAGAGRFRRGPTVTLDPMRARTPTSLASGRLGGSGTRNDLAVACADSHCVVVIVDAGEPGQSMRSPERAGRTSA